MAARRGAWTRREFLWRAAALGIALPSIPTFLQACAVAAPSVRPGATARPSQVVGSGIVPLPVEVTYGDELDVDGLTCETCPAGRLQDAVREAAEGVGVPVVFGQRRPEAGAALAIQLDAPDLPAQGYRLTVAADGRGAEIEIHGRDEAGALNGIQSLRQLMRSDVAGPHVQAATVLDHPGFLRRGAILDTPQPPTAADRLAQLDHVRLGARFKMNLLSLPDANRGHSLPDRALIEYCGAHDIELLSMIGYRDWLTTAPRAEVKGFVQDQVDLGIRSFSLNWDDIVIDESDDVAALVRAHAAVLADVYATLRALDPAIRVSVTLPPYGGVPGVNLGPAGRNGVGERYLELMRDAMPDDVVVFWTGDGGIFSHGVTSSGARAYAGAIGHRIALWDNEAMILARQGLPIIGGDHDLPAAVDAYMGNFVTQTAWSSADAWSQGDAQLTLITALDYAWNPGSYEPEAAMWRAAPWVPSWRGPRPIPTPNPIP